jgi:hypothetical protein
MTGDRDRAAMTEEIAGTPVTQAIGGQSGRPQIIIRLVMIGAISERFTGRAIGMSAEEIRDLMTAPISNIAGRLESQMVEMFAGDLRITQMGRRWSAEVLLFLNFVDLSTSWVSRPMGWP